MKQKVGQLIDNLTNLRPCILLFLLLLLVLNLTVFLEQYVNKYRHVALIDGSITFFYYNCTGLFWAANWKGFYLLLRPITPRTISLSILSC